jgi:hypothetical protein
MSNEVQFQSAVPPGSPLFRPLSEDQVLAVRGIAGLSLLRLQPNHSTLNGYPNGGTFLFEPHAPIHLPLHEGSPLQGYTAMYQTKTTNEADCQRTLKALNGVEFDKDNSYSVLKVDVDINTQRETVAWTPHLDRDHNTVAYVRSARRGEASIDFLLVSTHLAQASDEFVQFVKAHPGITYGQLMDHDFMARMNLATARNNQRIAAPICESAKTPSLLVGEDLYAYIDEDATDGSTAKRPAMAKPVYWATHNSLRWTNTTPRMVAFDRGASHVDLRNQQGAIMMLDPMTVATVLEYTGDKNVRGLVLPYGGMPASPEESEENRKRMTQNADVRQNIEANIFWQGKKPGDLLPSLYRQRVETAEQISARIRDLVGADYRELPLTLITSITPAKSHCCP